MRVHLERTQSYGIKTERDTERYRSRRRRGHIPFMIAINKWVNSASITKRNVVCSEGNLKIEAQKNRGFQLFRRQKMWDCLEKPCEYICRQLYFLKNYDR